MNSIQNAAMSPAALPSPAGKTSQTSDAASFKDFLLKSIDEVNRRSSRRTRPLNP